MLQRSKVGWTGPLGKLIIFGTMQFLWFKWHWLRGLLVYLEYVSTGFVMDTRKN